MANTVDVTYVVDGSKRVIAHVYIASDGVAGELTDQVIIDASALNPVPNNLTLHKIEGVFSGCSAFLEWDQTTDAGIMTIPDGTKIDFHFTKFIGLPNPQGAGTTGDMVLSTTGFTAAGDTGFLVIECYKS